jgi:hypothetical protein
MGWMETTKETFISVVKTISKCTKNQLSNKAQSGRGAEKE